MKQNKKDAYCLVLGGGGARGVYHLGVWKALREMNIPINAVIGNSVGALVAGFIAQNDIKGLEEVIGNIGLSDIIAIPKELEKNGEFVLDPDNFKVLLDYRKKIFKKRGLDTLPLTKTLEKYLDEKTIRNSGIDLGVIAYHLNELKPVEIFLDQMEEGSVLDYLKASATLPGFSVTSISDKQFIDGGVYNNIPFDTATKRGYRNIILVDISGIGRNKRPDFKNTRSVYIKNSVTMGGVLDFNKEFHKRFTHLGYLDTMRVFGHYKGWRYFIEEDTRTYRKLEKAAASEEFAAYVRERARKFQLPKEYEIVSLIRQLLPDEIQYYRDWIYAVCDCAAWVLEIDRAQAYPLKSLLSVVHEQCSIAEASVSSLQEHFSTKHMKRIIADITVLGKRKDFSSLAHPSIYYYERIIEEYFSKIQSMIPFASFETLYPGVHAGFAGLKLIKIYMQSPK